MTIKRNDYKEQCKYLKALLNAAHAERESLGRELHASKAYLNELAIILGRLERMNTSSIQILEQVVSEQKQVVNDFRLVLQDIRTRIYPPLINLSGVLIGIKQFVFDYQKANPVNVELEYDENTKDQLSSVKDLSVYKTCIAVIGYLFSARIRAMQIKLYCDGQVLEFNVAAKMGKGKLDENNIARALRDVKAHLIWSGAIVSNETNWKDHFKIKFVV